VILIDAWKLFRDQFQAQRDLEKKRRAFNSLTDQPLNYQIIEDIARTVASQRPGFYSVLRFKDGNSWELGVRDTAAPEPRRKEGETF
jgi:hypothetical protein